MLWEAPLLSQNRVEGPPRPRLYTSAILLIHNQDLANQETVTSEAIVASRNGVVFANHLPQRCPLNVPRQRQMTISHDQFSPAEKLDEAVSSIASRINEDYRGQTPLFLVLLNGAFMFAADLFKKMEMACEISFVKLASYSGMKSSSQVKELIGLNDLLKGRQVIIVEDIIDSGITMEHLIGKLNELGVAELKIATLFFKPEAFKKDYTIDYIGMSIPNDFIVGYGLDYDGYGRNFADIYKIVE